LLHSVGLGTVVVMVNVLQRFLDTYLGKLVHAILVYLPLMTFYILKNNIVKTCFERISLLESFTTHDKRIK